MGSIGLFVWIAMGSVQVGSWGRKQSRLQISTFVLPNEVSYGEDLLLQA